MTYPPVTIQKSNLFRIGGLEKYTWQIAKAFRDKGAAVTILTTGDVAPPFADDLIKIVSFPIDSPLSFLNVNAFDRACHHYLSQHRSPIVFGLDRNRFQTHLRAGNGAHASYLKQRSQTEGRLKTMSFALNPLHRLLLKLEKGSFEHPELQILFTNSDMVRSDILSTYAVDPRKVQVVHNGVEWQEFQSEFDAWESARPQVAHELGLDLGCYQLLFIGHNYERKGLDKLLQGLSLLPTRSFQLSVVGKEKDQAKFQRLASDYKLDPYVRFYGPQREIRRFYQVADALVVPSLYDPFANVTVEALAMGLFVVSSRHNGGHEVLTPETGTLIDALHDPHSVAEALQIALKHPKTSRSARAIRMAVARLDFPNQLEMIVQGCLQS